MDNKKEFIGVIIPAAGSGNRMGGVYKPLEKICEREMLLYSLDAFERCDEVAFVVISAREDKKDELLRLCRKEGYSKPIKIVSGGKDRQDSVENAFACSLFDNENITHLAVHDAARPLFTPEMAKKVFTMAREKTNAVCACRVRDTVKRTDENAIVSESVDREGLWLIQTPQVFEKGQYASSLKKAKQDGFVATDDSSLVSANGIPVNLCETPSTNIKVTYPEDMVMAEAVIEKQIKEGEKKS